ncbi:hypothetical protein FXO38_06889 [Capsicum annuum]|nr:hypothetical protein FXO37_28824 [Capsicum annuum]KAF3670831.1 hypothetical protein FXO38_06889 [Capsicum annuum]
MLSIAEELNIPKYVYYPSTAWTLASSCKALRPDDVVDPMLDRSDQQHEEYLKLGMEFGYFDGILINTWDDLEPEAIKALPSNEKLRSVLKVPDFLIYPIGP